jgi:photosystem II stability/assembly factor-like uncharacterized protein
LRLKLLVGASLALLLCHRSGAQAWERLGPDGGMVVSLGTSPGGELYLGTTDGHVFGSEDGARSWELRGRVGSRLDAVVTRLVADPRKENCLFAAVWYQTAGAGGGVFQSVDGGNTWKPAGLEGEAVRALEISPSQPDELVAGTRTGVFRSFDAGRTWERISPAGDEELRNVDSVAIDPRNPELIYAGTYHLPWKTTDGGKTWKPVTMGIIDDSDVMSLRIDATNPERLFMSACSGIYRSENQGGAWTKLQGIPYAARRTQAIVQDPGSPKTLYAATTEGLWVTRDGGESWTRTTPKDWVVNSVVVLAGGAGGSERVVLGTEGQGVQVSDDAGQSFSEANRGFIHVVVRQLLVDPNAPGHLLMVVAQDGGEILESGDEGRNWVPISLAAEDHGKSIKLNADQLEQAFASPWGWLLRFGNGQLWLLGEGQKGWKEWKLRPPARNASGKAGGTGAAARSQDTRLPEPGIQIVFSRSAAFVSVASGLVRCLPSGICTRLRAFTGGELIRALWVSSTGSEIAVVRDGELGLSTDGGDSTVWRDLPVANERVLWLDLAESGSGTTLFLGTSKGLYISNNAAANWERVEGGLPAGQMERFLHDSRFWVATERDGGMYLTQDEGSTWKRVDGDAERGRFTGVVTMGQGEILAGSQSEGLLRVGILPIQRATGE